DPARALHRLAPDRRLAGCAAWTAVAAEVLQRRHRDPRLDLGAALPGLARLRPSVDHRDELPVDLRQNPAEDQGLGLLKPYICIGTSSKTSTVNRPLPSARNGWPSSNRRAASRLSAST